MCLVDILRIKWNVSLYKSRRYYPLETLYFSHFFSFFFLCDNSGAITSEHLIVTFPFSRETLGTRCWRGKESGKTRSNIDFRIDSVGENYSHSLRGGRSACFIEREIYPLLRFVVSTNKFIRFLQTIIKKIELVNWIFIQEIYKDRYTGSENSHKSKLTRFTVITVITGRAEALTWRHADPW